MQRTLINSIKPRKESWIIIKVENNKRIFQTYHYIVMIKLVVHFPIFHFNDF